MARASFASLGSLSYAMLVRGPLAPLKCILAFRPGLSSFCFGTCMFLSFVVFGGYAAKVLTVIYMVSLNEVKFVTRLDTCLIVESLTIVV